MFNLPKSLQSRSLILKKKFFFGIEDRILEVQVESQINRIDCKRHVGAEKAPSGHLEFAERLRMIGGALPQERKLQTDSYPPPPPPLTLFFYWFNSACLKSESINCSCFVWIIRTMFDEQRFLVEGIWWVHLVGMRDAYLGSSIWALQLVSYKCLSAFAEYWPR